MKSKNYEEFLKNPFSKSFAEWGRYYGVSRQRMHQYALSRGVRFGRKHSARLQIQKKIATKKYPELFSCPEKFTVSEWAKKYNVNYYTIREMKKKYLLKTKKYTGKGDGKYVGMLKNPRLMNRRQWAIKNNWHYATVWRLWKKYNLPAKIKNKKK